RRGGPARPQRGRRGRAAARLARRGRVPVRVRIGGGSVVEERRPEGDASRNQLQCLETTCSVSKPPHAPVRFRDASAARALLNLRYSVDAAFAASTCYRSLSEMICITDV